MAKLHLNQARKPFVSAGPLVGLTGLVVLVLTMIAIRSVFGIFGAVAEERRTRRAIFENQGYARAATAAAKKLAGQVSEAEAKEVMRIATSIQEIMQKRRLSWSELLDDISEVLPDDVKVLSILPDVHDNKLGLVMSSVAKSDKAMLRFFAQLNRPPFSGARILTETLEKGKIAFAIACDYNLLQPNDDPSSPAASAGAPGERATAHTVLEDPATTLAATLGEQR